MIQGTVPAPPASKVGKIRRKSLLRSPASRIFVLALLLAAAVALPATGAYAQPAATLRIHVIDAQQLPVPGALCVLTTSGEPAAVPLGTATTPADGVASLQAAPGAYWLRVAIDGFTPYSAAVELRPGAVLDVIAALAPAMSERVTVSAADPVDAPAAGATRPAATLRRSILSRLPISLADLTDALPLVPGVIRSATGEITMNGASEEQNAFLVNGLSATDPSTGGFRLALPVDAVEAAQVFLHPYAAEYGQFTGGLTHVETRSGGDHWHAELNDFLPDLRFVHGRIVGIAEDSPHLNVNGPLKRNRIFLMQSAAYTIAKRPVRGLEFPENETKTEAASSFTQVDATLSSRHSVTATFGYFPARHDYVGLDVFRPQSASPSAAQRDLVTTVHDRLQIGGALLSSSVAFDRFATRVWPQGSNDAQLTPFGETGNYFARQDRRATRSEILEVLTLPSLRRAGVHDLKFGIDAKLKGESLVYSARPVNILRADGTIVRRIDFAAAPRIQAHNDEYVGFVQDRWAIAPAISVDLGLRYEDQRIADATLLAPRAAVVWAPGNGSTIVRGGAGVFYGTLPLNLRAFGQYPSRTVTQFARDGSITGQVRLTNLLLGLDNPNVAAAGDAGEQRAVVPQTFTWNAQVERTVAPWLTVRANATSSHTVHRFVIDRELDAQHNGYLVLRSSGAADYRSLELTTRVGPAAHAITLAYTRSRAMGNLNDFASIYGDFASPVIYPDEYAHTATDVPHRFIAWGAVTLPHRISVAPVFELRSGFPYTIVNENQSLAGPRNDDARRFPRFLALDLEISKDLQVTSRYGVRLSLRGFNVTNHFNPRDVRANTADPAFGTFLASYRRYFTGGFDILF